jgi:phosphate transport system permease protein
MTDKGLWVGDEKIEEKGMAIHTQATPLAKTEITAATLAKKPRVGEMLIQGFLFLCGALSILTTAGIIYILVTESLTLFRSQQWENTNKRIVAEVDETTTLLEVGTAGATLAAENIIRLGEEVMVVVAVNGSIITVQRGAQETAVAAHPAGQNIERASSVTVWETFTTTRWTPQLGEFGIWPLLYGTLATSIIAMFVALPVGLATAVYLSEYASERVRSTLKPILEILAGIPTVVFGFFALYYVTPLLRSFLGDNVVQIFNVMSAGIVVGILIVPLVSSMSEDALHAVPRSLREASYGLGATKLETSLRIVMPAALSGIMAAVVVSISRAIGETMVVAIAAGSGPKNFTLGKDGLFSFILNPFLSAETMTGHIVRISSGDLSYNSIDYNSLFAIGLLLFVMTLCLNIVARYFVNKYREVYE